jgi:hypothetical protein
VLQLVGSMLRQRLSVIEVVEEQVREALRMNLSNLQKQIEKQIGNIYKKLMNILPMISDTCNSMSRSA